ncbi:alpha/beta hydrolase [Sphingobacterium sp. SRCM116780]|uniref:alpha/beta hydrolase n=1 Tax=Sphingobacterium sp. SRCM116780 TaxID=2907623 RepID=UPI001F17E5C1|nr:alpha/beta hydrolase [Sphingobacterium sp. SRCM116780]UIR54903.1 alpha/beta hydrolase [Sphingobacterium sp. SRCM116780]
MLFGKIKIVLTLVLTTFSLLIFAQDIYTKTYGDKNKPAIIYIHGGPRGNATLFEGTTAQTLADKGYFVIVYDRRGEGRSSDPNAKLTFEEAFNDLNGVILKYGLKKVTIIGHSFGGLVSTLYTNKYPEKVDRLILVGALFAQQESYDHILKTGLKKAQQNHDKQTIQRINTINKLDKKSAAYRKQVYEVASYFGYFNMPNPTTESKLINKSYTESEYSKSNIRNDEAPLLFYKNEKQVNIDTKAILKKIKVKKVKLSAIYGKQDGIFSEKQILSLRKIVGEANFYSIENCSHYPFVDQQHEFLEDLQVILVR